MASLTSSFPDDPIGRRAAWRAWLVSIGIARPEDEIGPVEPAPVPAGVLQALVDQEVAAGRASRSTGRRGNFGRWAGPKHPSDLFIPPTGLAKSAVLKDDHERLERRYDAGRTRAAREVIEEDGERRPLRFDGALYARLVGHALQPTCGNPAGCRAPLKSGGRCSACHQYRRTHRGQERPAHLVARTNRRY